MDQDQAGNLHIKVQSMKVGDRVIMPPRDIAGNPATPTLNAIECNLTRPSLWCRVLEYLGIASSSRMHELHAMARQLRLELRGLNRTVELISQNTAHETEAERRELRNHEFRLNTINVAAQSALGQITQLEHHLGLTRTYSAPEHYRLDSVPKPRGGSRSGSTKTGTVSRSQTSTTRSKSSS